MTPLMTVEKNIYLYREDLKEQARALILEARDFNIKIPSYFTDREKIKESGGSDFVEITSEFYSNFMKKIHAMRSSVEEHVKLLRNELSPTSP